MCTRQYHGLLKRHHVMIEIVTTKSKQLNLNMTIYAFNFDFLLMQDLFSPFSNGLGKSTKKKTI